MKKIVLSVLVAATCMLTVFASNAGGPGGTVTRGDNTGKLTEGHWSNYRKSIGLKNKYSTVTADFNFADEFETGTYTVSTFSDEHILDGGKTWGGVHLLEGGGQSNLVSGKVEITIDEDDNCKIVANGVDDKGNTVSVIWEGPLTKDPYDY